MARGGINKVRVAKARQSLISQGKNPSIDAVRVALGNTGSKSTIHRYLKEIEEQEATQLDDEALLSQPIRELICRLASTLKQEAQQLVEEQQHQADQQQRKMQQQHHELEQQVTQLRDTLQQMNSGWPIPNNNCSASSAPAITGRPKPGKIISRQKPFRA